MDSLAFWVYQSNRSCSCGATGPRGMVRGGHSIGPDNVTRPPRHRSRALGQLRVSALLVPCCCPRAVALAHCQRAISPVTESSSPLSTSMGHRSPTSTSTSISISQRRFSISYPTTTLVLIADNQDIASYLVSTSDSPLLEPSALGTSTSQPARS
jgi:hypothetical protein